MVKTFILATESPDPRRVAEGFQKVSEGFWQGSLKGFRRVLDGFFRRVF